MDPSYTGIRIGEVAREPTYRPRANANPRFKTTECRDSFGDIFTLTSRVEPNYRQDLYVGRTA